VSLGCVCLCVRIRSGGFRHSKYKEREFLSIPSIQRDTLASQGLRFEEYGLRSTGTD